jgi:putative ABC transport system permease protein
VLAAAQIALAVTLLIGAGLLLRSFVMRVSVPLGFRPAGVLAANLPWNVNPHIDDLLERLRALPGVRAAGAATAFPQDAAGSSCAGCLEIEGQPRREGKEWVTGVMVATPGYLQAAGMTIERGRFFTAADGKDAPAVVVINQALARRDFPNQDPIGRRVRWGVPEWSTVIGVAGNVKGFGVAGDPMPTVYFANGQAHWANGVEVLVRTATPPLSLASAVRREMRSWNKRMIVTEFDTLDNMLAEFVAVPRFYLLLVAGFAALALLVSAVGAYGTVNYSVARRTHEIGIRMALGAQRGDVLAMILRQGLGLTAAGVVLGLAGALVSTRVLETLLFGVRPIDAEAFAFGAGAIVLAVMFACYIPARRATRVDPLESLRHE